MKKIFVVLLLLAVSIVFSSCEYESAKSKISRTQENTLSTALESVPIPIVSYFQERRTIAKWTERWDKPSIVTYVYLISFGNIIGYYVADGKPASTRSYLFPEMELASKINSESTALPTTDIDGTNGENNPGIRFFTAEGTAVEWGGNGAAYLYSDAPLPINVPKLNIIKK